MSSPLNASAVLDNTAVRENLLDLVANFESNPSHDTPNIPTPTIIEMARDGSFQFQCVLAFWSDSTGRFNRLLEVSLGGLVKDLQGHHFTELRASLRSVGEGESPTVHVS